MIRLSLDPDHRGKAVLFLTDERGKSCEVELDGRHARTLFVLLLSDRLDLAKGRAEAVRGFRNVNKVAQALAKLVGAMNDVQPGTIRHNVNSIRRAVGNAAALNGLTPGIEDGLIETVSRMGYRVGNLGRLIEIDFRSDSDLPLEEIERA